MRFFFFYFLLFTPSFPRSLLFSSSTRPSPFALLRSLPFTLSFSRSFSLLLYPTLTKRERHSRPVDDRSLDTLFYHCRWPWTTSIPCSGIHRLLPSVGLCRLAHMLENLHQALTPCSPDSPCVIRVQGPFGPDGLDSFQTVAPPGMGAPALRQC